MLHAIDGLSIAMASGVPRRRDYHDPAVFDVNRDVIRRFLAMAKMTSEPVAAFSP